MSNSEFDEFIIEVRKAHGHGFTKTLREVSLFSTALQISLDYLIFGIKMKKNLSYQMEKLFLEELMVVVNQ